MSECMCYDKELFGIARFTSGQTQIIETFIWDRPSRKERNHCYYHFVKDGENKWKLLVDDIKEPGYD